MSDHECPFGSQYCPKVLALESEVKEMEDDFKGDIDAIHKAIGNMSKTLYVIAGILFCEFGVMII